MPSAPWKRGAVLGGDLVLALPLVKVIRRDLLLVGKAVDVGMNALLMGSMSAERGEGVTAMKTEEGGDTSPLRLQLGLVDIEVHAVNAFDLEGDVPAQDFGDGAWYAHGWLRSSRVLCGPIEPRARTSLGTSQPARPEPPYTASAPQSPVLLVGLRRSPLLRDKGQRC